ncbi:MAG: hypothetical protein R3D34_14775 [Nitratireductor sp.]
MARLYCVHKAKSEAKADVIFVHGLRGEAKATFTNSKGEYWPDWIAEDFDDVAVWAYEYDAAMFDWFGGSLALPDAGTLMLEVFGNNGDVLSGRQIFVCHSLGGLMVKQMLRHANDRAEREEFSRNLVDRTTGVFFAATPHFGSGKADLLGYMRIFTRRSEATKGLEKNNAHLRDLNNWYRNWDRVDAQRAIRHAIHYETERTAGLVGIVDPGSADAGLPGCIPIPAQGRDHRNIVKPEDRDVPIHGSLVRFIRECIGSPVVKNRFQEAQEDRDKKHKDLFENIKSLEYSIDIPSRLNFIKMYINEEEEKKKKIQDLINLIIYYVSLDDVNVDFRTDVVEKFNYVLNNDVAKCEKNIDNARKRQRDIYNSAIRGM